MNISIDWNEVVLIIIGAMIGFVVSLITTITQRLIDKHGKLNIFYKFAVLKNSDYGSWGLDHTDDKTHFEQEEKGLAFTVPVIFEFQNTSNTTRVIRDVSLLLYTDKIFVTKMIQSDHFNSTEKTGSVVTKTSDSYFGGDNGSYSFVLPPRSIQKQRCLFLHTFERTRKNEYLFNKLVLRYFDEKNKPHMYEIKNLSDLWEKTRYKADKEWNDLKNCKKL